MISGRKITIRKLKGTPPAELIGRLNYPHIIPFRDNVFREIDHNTVGYLDGLAASNHMSGTATDLVPEGYSLPVYGHNPDTGILTRDLWKLIFEKYRLLDASMLLRRRDEIDVLFNMMVNQRQVGKIDDELFSEIADRIKRFTQRRDGVAPKNRPTASSGNE